MIHSDINSENIEQVKNLYRSAFPKAEQMKFSQLVCLGQQEDYIFWAFYDKGQWIGFTHCALYKNNIYCMYLAIHPNYRNKGYGTKCLQYIQNQFPDGNLLGEIEICDPSAENNDLRMRRREFYMRNGFHSAQYTISAFNITYEIICTKDFYPEIYRELVERLHLFKEVPPLKKLESTL